MTNDNPNRAQVERWWASLTAEQRATLRHAARTGAGQPVDAEPISGPDGELIGLERVPPATVQLPGYLLEDDEGNPLDD